MEPLSTPEVETARALCAGERLPHPRAMDIRTVFDVGAGVGDYATNALRVWPQAHVFAFEPNPAAYPLLEKWAQENGQGRVSTYQLALADRGPHLGFTFVHGEPSTSSLLAPTRWLYARAPQVAAQRHILVPATTLDEFLARAEIGPVGPEMALKMDVQGAEHLVLRGARKTLQSVRYVVLELMLDRLYEGQATLYDICRELEPHGLRYAGNMSQTRNPDADTIMWIDATFVK